jgi:hypothetical protein
MVLVVCSGKPIQELAFSGLFNIYIQFFLAYTIWPVLAGLFTLACFGWYVPAGLF